MTDNMTSATTRRTENGKDAYEIQWKIPNYDTLLRSIVAGTEIIVDTENSEESTESRILLKIQIVNLNYNSDILFICHYLSPIDAYLSSQLQVSNDLFKSRRWHDNCACTYCCVLRVNRSQFTGTTSLNFQGNYQKVLANKWQYLTNWVDSMNHMINNDGLELNFIFINDLKILKSEVPNSRLSSDFEKLLYNGLFADATIKSAEGKEYKVHKLILVSRSAVIKAFFEHDNIQSSSNILESPFESEVLEEVLTFMYSDRAPRVQKIADALLVAADYYQLNKLKSLCTEALQEQLTLDNAMETLHLAHIYSMSLLKRLTLEFIKEDQDAFITETEGWEECESAELLKDIYVYRCCHRSK